MEELLNLFKTLNIEPEKLQSLAQSAQENPFAALGKMQELGLSPEALQKVLQAVMANPEAVFQLAKQFGASDELMKNLENGLGLFNKE
ncbi:MAG: DUF2999 family protein [Proteobacteria bacterium]|nr:DUF2999 family protein [Pseudomonadota bacterium]